MECPLFDISGKTALITGSSRGIGIALARGLGRAGAAIILNGTDHERLSRAAEELRSEGISVYTAVFDVTDKMTVCKKIDDIEKDCGSIEILINNAGRQRRGALEDFELSKWEEIIDVNLTGVFIVSQCVVRKMKNRGYGKIINVCSLQCELARPGIAPYAASKGGVRMLTRSMAAEWARYNIQINGIGPGYFITDMTRSLSEDADFDAWLRKRTPAGRWGNTEELIGAAIFLSSKASDFINGQIIYVDGGLSAVI